MINRIMDLSKHVHHTCGTRRMSQSLQKEQINIGRYKTRRLMKAPELLNRQFDPSSLNTHWVGDITYIRTYHGWSYLACVLDLAIREVVGYAMSKSPDAQLAKDALMDVIRKQNPDTTKLMFHSDQGVQYSAKTFIKTLKLLRIT